MCLILTTYKQKNIILTMLKHTPTIILILVFCFCFSLFAPSLQAHIGGIPFINLNDKPTLVNDYNNYSGRTDIPQDDAPETFLINQPTNLRLFRNIFKFPKMCSKNQNSAGNSIRKKTNTKPAVLFHTALINLKHISL